MSISYIKCYAIIFYNHYKNLYLYTKIIGKFCIECVIVVLKLIKTNFWP